MPSAEEELRAALRLLEPKIEQFEAREREAAAVRPAGDPMLESLRHHLALLREEQVRLREQLRTLSR